MTSHDADVEVPLMPWKIWVILADINSWNEHQKPLKNGGLGDWDDPFLLGNGLFFRGYAWGLGLLGWLTTWMIYIQPWDSDRPQISERWQETYVRKNRNGKG